MRDWLAFKGTFLGRGFYGQPRAQPTDGLVWDWRQMGIKGFKIPGPRDSLRYPDRVAIAGLQNTLLQIRNQGGFYREALQELNRLPISSPLQFCTLRIIEPEFVSSGERLRDGLRDWLRKRWQPESDRVILALCFFGSSDLERIGLQPLSEKPSQRREQRSLWDRTMAKGIFERGSDDRPFVIGTNLAIAREFLAPLREQMADSSGRFELIYRILTTPLLSPTKEEAHPTLRIFNWVLQGMVLPLADPEKLTGIIRENGHDLFAQIWQQYLVPILQDQSQSPSMVRDLLKRHMVMLNLNDSAWTGQVEKIIGDEIDSRDFQKRKKAPSPLDTRGKTGPRIREPRVRIKFLKPKIGRKPRVKIALGRRNPGENAFQWLARPRGVTPQRPLSHERIAQLIDWVNRMNQGLPLVA